MPIESCRSEVPENPGIYLIRSTRDGKFYVGSTVNMRSRWNVHRRALRSGTHHNAHLQSAWNKYGESHFEFVVLKHAPTEKLLEAEQSWIDRTRCTDRSVGFNISSLACTAGESLARTWDGFYDPDGMRCSITNLFDFCRRRGLDFPSMHRLAKGRSKPKSYRGWTHENSVRKRPYIKTWEGFIDPDGRSIEPFRNLAAFCRHRGLDTTHMLAVARGRLVSHRGWTHRNAKRRVPPRIHEGFISPTGTRVTITNLKAFCKHHGLCVAHMFELKSGKRHYHKGWTWRNDHDAQTPKSGRHTEIFEPPRFAKQSVPAEARP
jgi:group I intron endonuclease